MTQMQKTREKETNEMEKIFKALMYWINGEEFQVSITYIDCAISEANKTKELVSKKHIFHHKISLKQLELPFLDNYENPCCCYSYSCHFSVYSTQHSSISHTRG